MTLDGLAAARRHSHAFDRGNPLAERNTRRAMWLTLVAMGVEIAGGWWFNSMAVLADGWHMSSHALALGLAAFAYAFARRFAHDRRFAFGTWKVEILAGYTSALLLLGVAALMVVHSVERLLRPGVIQYRQAILIALLGLVVNLVCAWWLRDHHGHDGDDHHDHDGHTREGAHQHDLNLRSAYLHVLADAATSVLAIVALLGGLYLGAGWLDPVMGLLGAVLILVWAWGLLRSSGRILLDAQMDLPVVEDIRMAIETGPLVARISDLHVWQVARGRFACVVEVVADAGVRADDVRRILAAQPALAHITVELVPVAGAAASLQG